MEGLPDRSQEAAPFRFNAVTGHRPHPVARVTLRPRDGMPFTSSRSFEQGGSNLHSAAAATTGISTGSRPRSPNQPPRQQRMGVMKNPAQTIRVMEIECLDDRFHETSLRKTLLFRRPNMIRILEAPD
jgi:hypothetical protein